MPAPDAYKLIARIVADATDDQLDDASFRRRTQRAARQLQRALEQPTKPTTVRGASTSTRQRHAASSSRPAYRFIAVPKGAGGTTSVSVSNEEFAQLAEALGGDAQVSALARKVAVGYKPESGMSRSAYVGKRLRQRAARASK